MTTKNEPTVPNISIPVTTTYVIPYTTTRREYFAAKAMQGYCAVVNHPSIDDDPVIIASFAVKCADGTYRRTGQG